MTTNEKAVYDRERYQRNRVKVLERSRCYRASHKERIKEGWRRWLARHGITEAERNKAYYEDHKEERSVYRKKNSVVRSLYNAKRRAAKYANTPIDELLTSAQWLALLAAANGHCHYCGKEAKLTLDHVIPLSKGGKHSIDNVVPACKQCNDAKQARTPYQWLQSLKTVYSVQTVITGFGCGASNTGKV